MNFQHNVRVFLIYFISCISVCSLPTFGECPSADLNGDCRVDNKDLAILASQWLTEGEQRTPAPVITWVDVNDTGEGMKDEWGYPIEYSGFIGQMSKYEITNAQYCQYLNALKELNQITVYNDVVYATSDTYHFQPYYNLAGQGRNTLGASNGGAARIDHIGDLFIVEPGFESHPVTYVGWYGADAFCTYYGWRLPTELEWQAVADYDGSYSYGCGTSLYVYGGGHGNIIANFCDSEQPDGTTSVGAFGTYGYGVCEMAGSVWEWTSSVSDGYRIIRGGGWDSYPDNCTIWSWLEYDLLSMCDNIGFRVCR